MATDETKKKRGRPFGSKNDNKGPRDFHLVVQNPIHRRRWRFHRVDGLPIAKIAKDEGVDYATVKESIDLVDLYKDIHTIEEVNAAQSAVILANSKKEEEVLRDALDATMPVEVLDADGNKTTDWVPDRKTQLEAIDTITRKLHAIQPKAAHSTSVQVGVGIADARQIPPGFEERLREITSRRQEERALKPPEYEPAALEPPPVEVTEELLAQEPEEAS